MVSTNSTAGHSGAATPEKPAHNALPRRLDRHQQNDLIAWVQAWYDAGCAVHPAKTDGSKMPVAVKGGSPDRQPDTFPATYSSGRLAGMPHPRAGQRNPEAGEYGYGWGRIATGEMPRLTVDQVAAHIRAGRADGIGVICGRASGGVFMLEAEGRARDLLGKVKEVAERLGHLHLVERLAAGCVDESPSTGLHFYLRAADGNVPGNTVLASRPDTAAEHGRQVLFETRGQGGWSAVAPSAGRTHKSGKPYRFLRGGPSTIPTFSQAEIESLFSVFRAVDEMPAPEPAAIHQAAVHRRDRPAGDILPGDDFNERASWDEILHGWKRGQVVGDRQHWTRPGKDHGTSATTTDGVLCCFSSSTGLPVFDPSTKKNALSKFAAYAHLNHGGDFAAAARALWEQGYGSRRQDDTDGGQPVPVEPRPAPTGDCRTLADWRQEATARRIAAISQPGLHLDTSPTGSGKTHATNEALRRASTSLTVLPTHALCREQVAALQAEGIDAVAYPELTPETCQNYDAASHVQSLSLVVGAAVCPGCPHKDNCTFRIESARAEKAARRFCTGARVQRSEKCSEGVQVVVIDEMPENVLAPTVTITAKQIAPVATLAHGIRHFWHSEANADQKRFAGIMLNVVDAIHATCAEITTAGTVDVPLTMGGDVPKNWQRLLYDSIRQIGVGSSLDGDALLIVTKAAAGELDSLRIVTDLTRKGRLVHFVVGSWRPTLPGGAAVILLDATGNADDIAAAVGRPVDDCTPAGHLPLVHPVAQIPDDISRGTSSSTVAGLVEAFLAAHSEVQRLGIIGHSHHIRDLIEGGLLSEPSRERLAKWCYFGQGPDRGSNDWHTTCDHLLRLGTPRANPGDYRRWLVQHGLHDAAGKPDGDWGPRDWEAVTVDGRPVVVHGSGYQDADWHRAYTAVSRAAGQQADGRGRAILPEGIPVTILSNEPGPYLIAPSLTTTPAAARETAEIVRKLGKQAAGQQGAGSAKSPIENSYRENCASAPVRAADCLRAIMAAAGIDRRAAQVRLAQCVAEGLLVRPGGRRGWYAVPESADAPVPPSPVQKFVQADPPAVCTFAQRPAVVPPPVQAVVISATGPAVASPAVDVVADHAPATTTATCTATVQPADAPAFDALLEMVDERAAIMEHDGGLDRDTADRLAREMILGRDAVAPPPVPDIVVGVDHASLAVRSQPFVAETLRRIPGTTRLLPPNDSTFAAGRMHGASLRCTVHHRRQGVCQCGHDDWVKVSIHGGQSVRVDCRHCDRFGWFGVWYGRRLPSPYGDHEPAAVVGPPISTQSFDFLSITPTGSLVAT